MVTDPGDDCRQDVGEEALSLGMEKVTDTAAHLGLTQPYRGHRRCCGGEEKSSSRSGLMNPSAWKGMWPDTWT